MNENLSIDENRRALADLLLPVMPGGGEGCGPTHYEKLYPARALPPGAFVTRLGPSPTGFAHLGNLFMAFVNMRLAEQSDGVFFLRVEDTDREREVEGAVPMLIAALDYFGISFGEGVAMDKATGEVYENGDYAPYFQSKRKRVYSTFVRQLILEGKAYPCFLSEEEITTLRKEQEGAKLTPGIYGAYATYRGVKAEEAERLIAEGKKPVVRLNAEWAGEIASTDSIAVRDAIRGELTLPKNILDVVILKSDGLPTYHFAHATDDHLMRTTHVVRGEEWLSSLPIHIALFDALGWKPPIYCHTALLMKLENGNKRKLSKRKDPELALSYYIAEGYHPRAIEEYLLTVINSNYEEWRAANPSAPTSDFTVTPEKMGVSGILFDLDKLSDISKETLSHIPADELAAFMLEWAGRERPDILPVLERDFGILMGALDVGRAGDKPRKDLAYGKQILEFLSFYFDELFTRTDGLPENVSVADAKAILEGYMETYDHEDERDIWFEKIRALAVRLGYAAKPKDFKKEPELYKGHVGDVSTVIRLALTGRRDSPDLREIQQVLGEERVRSRISGAITLTGTL